ncbi:MAG TPA: TolC family protein [Gemmatimonadales bacterium]
MRLLLCSLAACLAATPLVAQTPSPNPAPAAGSTLTLDEALGLARSNNPAFLQTVEGRTRAAAQLRSAYGALLPDLRSSFTTGFRQGRQQFFGGVALGATGDLITSSYDLSTSLTLNQSVLLGPRAQKANQNATEAEITAGAQQLSSDVATQYLAVLQQEARAALQDTLVATAEAQLELARVRASVGSATQLDVQRAEVELGQRRVNVLQARNQAEVEKLRLFQMMGVEQPEGVRLTTEFPITRPELSLDQLLGMAQQGNPGTVALRERGRAADVGVSQARGQYLPSLTLSTGIGGYTSEFTDANFLVDQQTMSMRGSCMQENELRAIVGLPPSNPNCASLTLSPERVAQLRADNDAFPFAFDRDPWQISATLSLPIFNNFQREQRLQEAQVQRNETRYRLRAQELKVKADVTAAYRTLETSYQTVQLQEQNARLAREALRLAQERYRVGANTFVEVSQARDEYARAEADRINALYEYHKAYAALENAVGRRLR